MQSAPLLRDTLICQVESHVREAEFFPKYFREISLIAHRGAHSNTVPENSYLAFRKAIDSGFGIETDIRITRDRIPVCFHDASLYRSCGIPRLLHLQEWKYLKDISLGGSNQKIPSLLDILDEFSGKPLLLHIKTHNAAIAVRKLLQQNFSYEDGIIVQGAPINIAPLRRFKNLRVIELHGKSSFFVHSLFGYFSKLSRRRALSLSLDIDRVFGSKRVLSDWPVLFRYTAKTENDVHQIRETGAIPISDWLPY